MSAAKAFGSNLQAYSSAPLRFFFALYFIFGSSFVRISVVETMKLDALSMDDSFSCCIAADKIGRFFAASASIRTEACLLWAQSGHLMGFFRCPLCPPKQSLEILVFQWNCRYRVRLDQRQVQWFQLWKRERAALLEMLARLQMERQKLHVHRDLLVANGRRAPTVRAICFSNSKSTKKTTPMPITMSPSKNETAEVPNTVCSGGA